MKFKNLLNTFTYLIGNYLSACSQISNRSTDEAGSWRTPTPRPCGWSVWTPPVRTPTVAGSRHLKGTRGCPAGILSCLPAFPAGRIVRELVPEKKDTRSVKLLAFRFWKWKLTARRLTPTSVYNLIIHWYKDMSHMTPKTIMLYSKKYWLYIMANNAIIFIDLEPNIIKNTVIQS